MWCHLRPSGVMPRYLVVSIPCRIDAPVPHQSFPLSPPIVSVIDMFLSRNVPSHSSLWATLTDLSYQNRAMPASLLFHHPFLPSILWTSTVFPRTLDDVVVTPCSDPRSPSSSSPPCPSRWNQCKPLFGVALFTPTPFHTLIHYRAHRHSM